MPSILISILERFQVTRGKKGISRPEVSLRNPDIMERFEAASALFEAARPQFGQAPATYDTTMTIRPVTIHRE
jgi:hypothetical protein